MMRWLVVVATVLRVAHVAAADPAVYHLRDRRIYITELPGGVPRAIYTSAYDGGYDNTRPIYIEIYRDHLYWTTYATGQLWTADLNGGNARTLLNTVVTSPRGITFNGDSIYWATGYSADIYRAKLDGSDVQRIYDGPGGFYDGTEDIEIYGERIYWTTWSNTSIRTCRLDGSDYQEIQLAGGGRAFCLEIHNDIMYVGVQTMGPEQVDCLLRCSMDGTIYDMLTRDHYILSMDILGDRIYYNCEEQSGVYSISLAGGDERLEFQAYTWQLAVVPEPFSFGIMAVGAITLAIVRRTRRAPR